MFKTIIYYYNKFRLWDGTTPKIQRISLCIFIIFQFYTDKTLPAKHYYYKYN